MSTASYTVTHTQQRARAFSLSVVADVSAMPRKTKLDTLPAEVLLDILRYALPQAPHGHHRKVNVSSLATVNRALYTACAALIYRSVVLHSTRALALFARTAATHPSLLATHVRSFAFTYEGRMRPELRTVLGAAIRACSNMHTLVIPGAALPGLELPQARSALPAPKHVTLSGWGDITSLFSRTPSPSYPAELFRETTHLSIANPPSVWARPRDILLALGDPAHLTHLNLARRTGGNTDNDAEFVEDVLELRTRVKNVVVSMCSHDYVANSGSTEAVGAFVKAIDDLGAAMRRGDVDEWRAPWTKVELGTHGSGLEERFWVQVPVVA